MVAIIGHCWSPLVTLQLMTPLDTPHKFVISFLALKIEKIQAVSRFCCEKNEAFSFFLISFLQTPYFKKLHAIVTK